VTGSLDLPYLTNGRQNLHDFFKIEPQDDRIGVALWHFFKALIQRGTESIYENR
jgi:hypothetical protein